jgi:predicted metal-binding protein
MEIIETVEKVMLKSYPATWDGTLLLVCRKCQKKIKHGNGPKALSSLKKASKKRRLSLHVLSVPCMDLCPKNGVTVCVPGVSDERLFILRGASDLDEVARQMEIGQ